MTTVGEVKLVVPASPEFARTARMAIGTLVADCAVGYDEVSDVRLAVEETFLYALSTCTPGAPVELVASVDAGLFELAASFGARCSGHEEDEGLALSLEVLSALCDDVAVSVVPAGHVLRISKRLTCANDAA